MSCEQYKSRLLDFALGAEDADLRAHLDGCPSCRAELEVQRGLLDKIDRGVAAMVSGEPSGDFAAHVRRRIAENAQAPRPWFVGWIPVTVAALALVVLVGVLTIGLPPRPPQSAQVTPPTPVAPVEKKQDVPRETAIVPRPPQGGQLASLQEPRVRIGQPQRPPQSAANREPEVLVPRGEMAAVMRLYEANWNGKADGASLVAQLPPMEDSLKPMAFDELRIPALQIVAPEDGEKPKRP